MDTLLQKVEEYIGRCGMLPVPKLVVGVSGGADSMALLFVLKEITKRKYPEMKLIAAHVHHGIRGQEADRDEKAVEAFCRKLSVPLEVTHLNIPKMAEEERISLETAGRKARYAFFSDLCGEEGRVAVAHHMEDQAESIAMHIFRGSGMDGLCGIRPVNGSVIRPFLCLRKKEILAFCEEKDIPYVTDSSNADTGYTRNFFRSEIFPRIDRGIHQDPVDALCHLGEKVSEESAFLDDLAQAKLQEMLIKCEGNTTGSGPNGRGVGGNAADSSAHDKHGVGRNTPDGNTPDGNGPASADSTDSTASAASTASTASVASAALADAGERKLRVSVKDLLSCALPLRRRILRLLAVRCWGDVVDMEAVHWEAVLSALEKKDGAKYLNFPNGRYMVLEKGEVGFEEGEESLNLPSGGYVSGVGFIKASCEEEPVIALKDLPIGEMVNFSQSFLQMRLRFIEKEAQVVYNDTTWFFPQSVLDTAVFRTRREGDKFKRAGSSATKELRRYMNEAGIPPRWRDRVMFAASSDDVLWIPGYGHAVGFTDEVSRERFEAENKEKVYCLELLPRTAGKEDMHHGKDF